MELEFLLAFRVWACVMGFSWFLWTFWYKDREIGQTRGGQIVKVALEVALWMWYKVACVVFRFLKYHIYDAGLADFLKRKFNSAWTWRADVVAYMAGECERVFYRLFFLACLAYLKVCKMANDFFRFILTGVVVVILSLVKLGKWMLKKVFRYAPDFAFWPLALICFVHLNQTISRETGVHQLNTTRHFFERLDNYSHGNGSVVKLVQELEIIGIPDRSQISLSDIWDYVQSPIHHTIVSLICQFITAAIQSYKTQFTQNGLWMNAVRAVMKSTVEAETKGNFANSILAWMFSALCVSIHLQAIWKFGGCVLCIYCIFYLWCMYIRIVHYGLWYGVVDWRLTYSHLAFFAYVAYVSSGSIKKKIMGWCARDVASAPGAASPSSPTPSALSREVTPEGFLLLRPSHERQRERDLFY